MERHLCDELMPLFDLTTVSLERYQEDSFYQTIAKRLKEKENLLEQVKDAYYRAFPGGHNSYSMLVLSHQIANMFEWKGFDCLYTGDVHVDDFVLGIESKYSPSYIQVPHHGSNYNHNLALYGFQHIAFISVGATNRYRHPGMKSLPDIIDTCKEVHIITELRTAFICSILFK